MIIRKKAKNIMRRVKRKVIFTVAVDGLMSFDRYSVLKGCFTVNDCNSPSIKIAPETKMEKERKK